MAEHDITLVTAKASGVVAEGLKLSLATASAALTPSTITAMVGMAQGGALRIAPAVTDSIAEMRAYASTLDANIHGALITSLNSNATALETQASQLLPPGNPAAFGSFLAQAQGHIGDAKELSETVAQISSTDFTDYGDGITSMSSMATQGIDTTLGSLTAAASAMTTAGALYDPANMSTLGTGEGLLNKFKTARLEYATGCIPALESAGVDVNDMGNSIYADKIAKVLKSITDPKVISTVLGQFGVTPGGVINSLNDLTDIKKLAGTAATVGLIGGLTDLGKKFGDIGASFPTPEAAATMLSGLEIPNVPKLDASAPSLSALMDSASSTIKNLVNPIGDSAPSMTDFMQSVAGGPTVDSMREAIASGNTSLVAAASASVGTLVTNTNTMVAAAGIDLTTPIPSNLGSTMVFATGLHSFGADKIGSGVSDILKNMATDDKFGEAIKASLAEGKNKALMTANGIRPLIFTAPEN